MPCVKAYCGQRLKSTDIGKMRPGCFLKAFEKALAAANKAWF
jgi:hypothetical protein